MSHFKYNLAPTTASPISPGAHRLAPRAWLVALLLGGSIILVYGRALNAPFIFDDRAALSDNESIRSIWPLVGPESRPGPLNPPRDLPTTGRPLVNASFALNYRYGKLEPIGYHVVSLLLHFASAMLLWAIVRRTLLMRYFAGQFDRSAGWLALTVAMLWALHPLQTEPVIYATQRTELMMAFFYLATFYYSQRYLITSPLPYREEVGSSNSTPSASPRAPSPQRLAWLLLAIIACLCGMASKEVMVSAPLMVLLFDRTFVSGSLSAALRRSWPLYLGLTATCILIILLHEPSQSAGFGLEVDTYAWWLTQTKVIWLYFKLALWPSPLLIHYDLPYLSSLSAAWPYALSLLLLGMATLFLLWRNSPIGYLLTWIFAILSPTSVVPIPTEMAAERRMYLPLAALVILIVVGAYSFFDLACRRLAASQIQSTLRPPFWLIAMPAVLIAFIYGALSAHRLADYHDEIELWQPVLELQPTSYKAHAALGTLLRRAERYSEAIEELRTALASKPNYSLAHNNLGVALLQAGQLPEAIQELETAVALKADDPTAHNNLGIALARQGRHTEAVDHFEKALVLKPAYARAHNNLGLALGSLEKLPQAVEHLQQALDLGEDDYLLRYNLGRFLDRAGRAAEAVPHLELAARLKPDRADIQTNLGVALRHIGRIDEAISHGQEALRLDPKYLQAYADLAASFAVAGRRDDAVATVQRARALAESAGQQTAVGQFEGLLKHLDSAIDSNDKAAQPATPK